MKQERARIDLKMETDTASRQNTAGEYIPRRIQEPQ
jgi:hypothetical protein